ncbi:MAG: ribonuclease III [Oscillospiraceae bacterium]|nr:ribonuclease III [Candidatus Equicaccousia limihippi]
MDDAIMLSGSTLAFVGDAVYGLCVRKELAKTERPLKELHSHSVEIVNATAQAKYFEVIADELNDTEMSVFKRGRNSKASNIPKNSLVSEYHTATGVEALFGYLFLSNQTERLNFLFEKIWNEYLKNKD